LSHAFDPAVTKDGKQVEVVAKIGDVSFANDAVKLGAEGVGLLRTEVLYLERQSDPEIGIMVEIPAAAILADKIIEHVDFFSIGSNDLTQYTLAVDRGNESISRFYQRLSPALFRLFKVIIEAAHSLGKWAGLCGELAGQKEAVPGLLGLGLDEFSMSPRSIPSIKALIRELSFEKAKPFAEELLNAKNADEVKELTAGFFKELQSKWTDNFVLRTIAKLTWWFVP
jgi:phosphoenolpyruvate-protein kinase (PTS system EI component)